jgi:hypothetical protein
VYDLETSDRRSLYPAASCEGFFEGLPVKVSLLSLAAKRPAGTPPSTFLFLPIHLSNSPEPCRSHFPASRKAVEASHFRSGSEAWVTEYQ